MATATSRKKCGRNHPCEAVFTAPHLSGEIIVEIISRLPVKSLCRFRCVSKLWLSTISSPQFAKTQLDLAFQNNTEKQVLIDFGNWKVCSIDWESISADDLINKGLVAHVLDNSLKDHPCLLTFHDILCSSNGLICIVDSNKESVLVINPCRESRKVLLGSQKLGKWYTFVYGFGYSSKSDDYKLVIMDSAFISMYSLRSDTWTKFTHPYRLPCGVSGLPLNGALHWISSGLTVDGCVVVSFDLDEKTIREMPGPSTLSRYEDVFRTILGVVNGCLCAWYCGGTADSLWVMREYNNGKSWTKISTSLVPLDTLGLAKKRFCTWDVDQKIVSCTFEDGTHGIPTGGNLK